MKSSTTMTIEKLHVSKAKGILLLIFLTIIIALFILSVSIAIPLLVRPIYYVQIESQGLPEQSGFSKEQIKEAYDDVMDYCTLGGEDSGRSFHTGALAWSEEGKDHFDDVQRLFRLDFTVAIITSALLAAYLLSQLILRKRKKAGLQPWRVLGRGPLFWGPSVLLAAFLSLTIAAVVDFDGFFTWFHHLFFPGKDNWLLDPDIDEIIRILPYEVLQIFAIIIVALILAGCTICIIADLRHFRSDRSSRAARRQKMS